MSYHEHQPSYNDCSRFYESPSEMVEDEHYKHSANRNCTNSKMLNDKKETVGSPNVYRNLINNPNVIRAQSSQNCHMNKLERMNPRYFTS
jgi:hypothetical protein